jgi:hypothetical protein
MAAWHGVALAGALVALLGLPCAVALLVNADQVAMRRSWRRDATTLEVLRRLDLWVRGRAVAVEPERGRGDARGPGSGADPILGGPAAEFVDVPCAEQIAAELRRLQHLRRHGPAGQSEAWLAAVTDAYDRWLVQACRTLGLSEELHSLDGLDRELERARIEEILRDKGF